MKKFEEVAMTENNKNWKKAIKREEELYKPVYTKTFSRSEFDRDYTRVIHCNAYRRLKHKTQVFFAPENDHICTRSEHVNLVDSISHTIAENLGLNTELTKAIAVSHDIGHSPFGHQGEKILSVISEREYKEKFWHERNGLHFVDDIELLKDYDGIDRNLNLTYAVRDGIISHCGEVDENGLKPRTEYIDLVEDYKSLNQYAPFTWEGCVVKLADKISYIGRDIEDAMQMHLLTEKDIQKLDEITASVKIGNSNIINYLVNDICVNSNIEDGLKLSDEAFETMNLIKNFNYKNIYLSDKIKPMIRYFTVVMNEMFYILKQEYSGINTLKNLKKLKRYYPTFPEEYSNWLKDYIDYEGKEKEKSANKILYDLHKPEDYYRSIIDYISGMTDHYMVKKYKEIISF